MNSAIKLMLGALAMVACTLNANAEGKIIIGNDYEIAIMRKNLKDWKRILKHKI